MNIDLNPRLIAALTETAQKAGLTVNQLIIQTLETQFAIKPVEAPAGTQRFNIFVNYDIGFGPETVDLGNINAGNYDAAMTEAEIKAKGFFHKTYPEDKFEEIKKQIKCRPINES